VYGQGGNDVIKELANGTVQVAITAVIFSGTGNSTLSVAGSSANNILVGGAGANTLAGGRGLDILIGGASADILNGGSGGDLLISGSTAYDANLTALLALLAEWGRTDRGYMDRVHDLFGTGAGGLNDAYLLNGTTVNGDTAANRLAGGSGDNWFWMSGLPLSLDAMSNWSSDEVATIK
jgi:Ca2+-binding RTX toxin-like protein